MAEPLPHEDQSPASGFQIDQEGTELMELVLGAIQPPSISTVAIVAGAIATPLDGSIHHVALTEDVDVAWTAPIPSGGDDATTGYYATVVFFPPDVDEGSGAEDDGPWIVPFPVGWHQLGGLDSISLAPGDNPIVVALASIGDGLVTVTAVELIEVVEDEE